MATGGPLNTAPAFPYVSFQPQKNYPSFSGQPNTVVILTTIPAAGGAFPVTTDAINGGVILSAATAAATATLPSATVMAQNTEGVQVNTAVIFRVKAQAAGTVTVAVGPGGTANPGDTLTVATGTVRTFMILFTAIGVSNPAAYTLYSLGSAAA